MREQVYALSLGKFLSRCIVGLSLFFSVALSAQTVLNRGVPGENSAEVLKRTPSMLQADTPAVVMVFVGMNDAANDKKFLTPGQTKANVLAMVQDIEARCCQCW